MTGGEMTGGEITGGEMTGGAMTGGGQILTVAQMRAAEAGLIAGGSSVAAMMAAAGEAAAQWTWRLAAGRRVTVLCGPGNNGGDGWVIAQALQARGLPVVVVAAAEPRGAEAKAARTAYAGAVAGAVDTVTGDVLVDCLYGSGLSRPLEPGDAALLARLAAAHPLRVAIDLPSGVDADRGAVLNDRLPTYQLTLALGAWKYAHWLMPAAALMGELRLVELGVASVPGAARALAGPQLAAPPPRAQKYTRGLLAVVAGEMPGAALLAARAAQHGGAGYVRLLSDEAVAAPPELVVQRGRLAKYLADTRISAVLVGPGLGRGAAARVRLRAVLGTGCPAVVDADALHLLSPAMVAGRTSALIVTPHGGELAALEKAFGLKSAGTKPERALALAQAGPMVVVAKGPDTVIAAPDGAVACGPRGSSWLSVAGTGDVLAGVIASRLAGGGDALAAAGEGVWLHSAASWRCRGPFTPVDLADALQDAFAACL